MPTDQVPTDVIARYDTPGPRYTSYPTVPAWKGAFGLPEFCEALVELAETESEAAKKQFAINLARALRIATTRPIKGHQLGLRGSQLRLSSRLSKAPGLLEEDSLPDGLSETWRVQNRRVRSYRPTGD